MSDSASQLARDANGIHQGLKELLKTHNPWDKEVEFSRKNLRRQYLRLLLVEPYARESKDAETHLWMQTSYQFISHYKQNLASLERTLQSAPRHQPRQGGHGPVEHRKLMQRFRQFLSDEEKFWTQFVVRYQRSFALREAHPVLVALNILTPSDDAHLPSLPDSADRNGGSNQNHGRNNFSFPTEESTPAPDPAKHESRLAILSKAIVCLGDIARYRELYNESGGRPKAGHEDGMVPAKRGGRGGRRGGVPGLDTIPRARNYDKAIQCYEQARLLVPYEGNSSHQLAILAFYQGDMFTSLFHYYRALCVRQPYDTASENVKKILNKAFDQHIKKIKAGPQTTTSESGEIPPRLRVEQLKENIVLLHGLWQLGANKIKVNPVTHAEIVAKDFQSLVSERILPIETVSKIVVLAQGALWKYRMIRDSSSPSNRRSHGPTNPSITESQILMHVIAIHRVLLEIGVAELAVPPEDAAENDLAQRITAPFRRTLPAMRIASKWVVANIKYLLHAAQRPVGERLGPIGGGTPRISVEGLPLFWAKFAQFYSALNGIFPSARLPSLTTPLDEDIDLKGFLPLRDLLVDGSVWIDGVPGNEREGQRNGTSPRGREKVHPNEEQLMRIWDLLTDATSLAEVEGCPIHLDGNLFSFDNNVLTISSADAPETAPRVPDQFFPYVPQDVSRVKELEDDAMTDTTRTDDDPVGDAFREALDAHGSVDDEEDQEVILWNPRPLRLSPESLPAALPATPILQSAIRSDDSSVVTKTSSTTTSRSTAPRSPVIVPRTTAQDLLNNVMGTKRTTVDASRPPLPPTSTAIQPQFPFGLGPNAPPSIWSTSLDEGSSPLNSPSMGLRNDVNVNQTFPSPSLQHAWSPQFESTQAGRHVAPQPPPHFQSPQSLSSVGLGHYQSMPLSLGGSQHIPQPPLPASYSSSGLMTQFADHRQPQWPNSNNVPFLDPAIVSAVTPSQPTTHYGLPTSYSGFLNGHTQEYKRPGQHGKSPSSSRAWGIHG